MTPKPTASLAGQMRWLRGEAPRDESPASLRAGVTLLASSRLDRQKPTGEPEAAAPSDIFKLCNRAKITTKTTTTTTTNIAAILVTPQNSRRQHRHRLQRQTAAKTAKTTPTTTTITTTRAPASRCRDARQPASCRLAMILVVALVVALAGPVWAGIGSGMGRHDDEAALLFGPLSSSKAHTAANKVFLARPNRATRPDEDLGALAAAALYAQTQQSSSPSSSSVVVGAGATPTSGRRGLVRTVNPGDRVNIPCSLANQGGSIQFAKDEQPIILDAGCAHCQLDISNEGQASLTINRVSARDQGHWQCWRLDSQGRVSQKVAIVELQVSDSPELPVLMVNDKELLAGANLDASITVRENELVSFRCLIRGASTPVDYVHWMLDSTQNITHLSQLRMEFSEREQNYLTQSLLKLNATKAMNLKSISCLANHPQWLTPMTVTAVLNVLYEPSFTISREPGFGVPVSEGMTVVLKCEIDSNPSSSPVWIRDPDTSTNNKSAEGSAEGSAAPAPGHAQLEPLVLDTRDDGSVIFGPAQRLHSGWYRCKTDNRHGNFSSYGYYLNVKPAAAPTGTQAHLLPTSSAGAATPQSPPASRVMAPNQPAARVFAPSAQNDQPREVIPFHQIAGHLQNPTQQLQLQPDPGNRCKNQGRLDGAPEIEQPQRTLLATLGRPLAISARFCADPAPSRLFWIHRHLAMIPGRMFGPYITRDLYTTYNSHYCYESIFEIDAVKLEDIGTVYMFVTNDKGHSGAQVNLQLAHPAKSALDHPHPASRFQQQPASSTSSLAPGTWGATWHLFVSLLVGVVLTRRRLFVDVS